MWQVFLAHHVVGCMPFFVNCFGCSNLHFLVSAGILIEGICPLLNTRSWLEMNGHTNTRAGAWAFVATYVVWVFLRVALPIYLTVGMFSQAIPKMKGVIVDWALIPSYITGVAITLFCALVWIAKLSPEIPWALRLLQTGEEGPQDQEKGVVTQQTQQQPMQQPQMPPPQPPTGGLSMPLQFIQPMQNLPYTQPMPVQASMPGGGGGVGVIGGSTSYPYGDMPGPYPI
eukprot:Tamp_13555.p1 GENE.Tamp_13555~~Tamp_13555.p1  ORF type:complete len:228 (-),score=23.29 Tamp_13555:259-942(-)